MGIHLTKEHRRDMKLLQRFTRFALRLSYFAIGVVGAFLPIDKTVKRGRPSVTTQLLSHWKAVGGYIQSAMDAEKQNQYGGGIR